MGARKRPRTPSRTSQGPRMRPPGDRTIQRTIGCYMASLCAYAVHTLRIRCITWTQSCDCVRGPLYGMDIPFLVYDGTRISLRQDRGKRKRFFLFMFFSYRVEFGLCYLCVLDTHRFSNPSLGIIMPRLGFPGIIYS